MAVRLDGYSGDSPTSYSFLVVNNTFYGVQSPYPNPDCCPSSPYDDRSQSGLINFFKADDADSGVAAAYIENNVFIDPPGENTVGFKVAIQVNEMDDNSCSYASYTQNQTYIRNNVTDAANMVPTNVNCDSGWGAYSNNTEGATLTDDLTDYANNDFTLKSGGDNLIDQGLATNAPALDFLGVSRPQGSADDIGAYEYSGDVTPPELSSATLASDGKTLTLVFDEAVSQGSGYADANWDMDCTVAGNNISLTYISGNGTSSHIYKNYDAPVHVGDTCNIDFNGDTDSEEDNSLNDLAAIVSDNVTNNSTISPTKLGVNFQ